MSRRRGNRLGAGKRGWLQKIRSGKLIHKKLGLVEREIELSNEDIRALFPNFQDYRLLQESAPFKPFADSCIYVDGTFLQKLYHFIKQYCIFLMDTII